MSGLREAGRDPLERARRSCLIDPYRAKVEELVERSNGKVRADVVYERLCALGYAGHERTTRRAMRQAKHAYRQGHRRTYEVYFSILQRKVLTPADTDSRDELAANILAFQAGYEVMAERFEWKFTRADLARLLQRLASNIPARASQAA